MKKEKEEKSGFFFLISVQSSLAALAILIIVFGGVKVATGGISIFLSIFGGVCLGITTWVLIYLSFRLKCFAKVKNDLRKNVGIIKFSWSQIVVVSIFVGIAEELLFRAAIQTLLASHTNIYIGILVSSLIFGVIHFSSISYAILSFIIGITLGVAYSVSQSIEFVVVWHIVVDLIGLGVNVKYPQLVNDSANTT